MPRHYKCISGDSHLDIRPERWTPPFTPNQAQGERRSL